MTDRSKLRKYNRITKLNGQQKQQKHRIKLFRLAFDRFITKPYPVLNRFQKVVASGKDIGYIRYRALQLALNYKIQEAIETAKGNLQDKITEEKNENT